MVPPISSLLHGELHYTANKSEDIQFSALSSKKGNATFKDKNLE